jgi:dGTPase
VSWADRIAYVCHDFEDAVAANLVTPEALPDLVRATCGTTRSSQLRAFISSMVRAAADSGRIGMLQPEAEALAAFRQFNYDNIYMRDASRAQAAAVIDLLRALVEHYAERPQLMLGGSPTHTRVAPVRSVEAFHDAVGFVGGMTDRYACRQGRVLLGFDESRLPKGIDVA